MQKLADLETGIAGDEDDRHPGAPVDDLARRTGVATALVRWSDLQGRRPRRPGAKRGM